ncbi:MAG TPA: hypothetical protein VJ732_20630 [Bryobacteraceae bacterium]|nr:hypothetical protein [Bryobacteraceae bacterium]
MEACGEKRRLMESAQSLLVLLAELILRQQEAVRTEAENTVRAIDQEIERHMQQRETAMGALRRHRREHGC